MNEGVARIDAESFNLKEYREELESRLGLTRSVMRSVINRAVSNPQRIVFSEGEDPTIIKAAAHCAREGICKPILLGQVRRIKAAINDLALEFDCEIIDPRYDSRRRGVYADELHEIRGRRGISKLDAVELLKQSTWFAPMMVRRGMRTVIWAE